MIVDVPNVSVACFLGCFGFGTISEATQTSVGFGNLVTYALPCFYCLFGRYEGFGVPLLNVFSISPSVIFCFLLSFVAVPMVRHVKACCPLKEGYS